MERKRDTTTGVVFKVFGGALVLAAAIWFLMPYLAHKNASVSTSTSTDQYGQSP